MRWFVASQELIFTGFQESQLCTAGKRSTVFHVLSFSKKWMVLQKNVNQNTDKAITRIMQLILLIL